MCVFWLTMAIWAGPAENPTATDSGPIKSARTGAELRNETRAALRRWSRPSDQEVDVAARELLGLFQQLQHDNALAPTERESLRGTVRGRLLNLSRQIDRQIVKHKQQAKTAVQRPASIDRAAAGSEVLAQRAGFGIQAPGPGAGAVQSANGDYGQDLVDLIQRTIAPASWDVNGGPGTIYYWRPGRALVIRQTDEIHRAIGGVIEQLERANR